MNDYIYWFTKIDVVAVKLSQKGKQKFRWNGWVHDNVSRQAKLTEGIFSFSPLSRIVVASRIIPNISSCLNLFGHETQLTSQTYIITEVLQLYNLI
jgi:hypothetical protein